MRLRHANGATVSVADEKGEALASRGFSPVDVPAAPAKKAPAKKSASSKSSKK